MIARAEHTRQLLAHLRALPIAPRRRRKAKRIPRQRQPDALRVEYWRAILPVMQHARAEFEKEAPHILHQLAQLRREQGKTDADPKDEAEKAVDRAARRATSGLRPDELLNVARQFGKRTTDFQKKQLDAQVRAAIGIPYDAIEKPTADRVEEWAALNVDLITTVPERYFDRLRLDVEEAFSTGIRAETLSDRFEEDYDIGERDAMRIARDQIGKLNGQVNQDRQEALGISRFIWRTMNDERVRDSHEELEGEVYDWEDPPDVDGEPAIPGQPIQCRCYAEPDFSELTGEGEEEGGEE